MAEDNLSAHQQNDPRFIPGCGYGSEAYKMRERILAPRHKKDDDPLIVYIGGPCGAGKSSLVKTIRYLLDNDFDADWKAVPRVPPFTRGCGAAQGSVTRGIDHYEVSMTRAVAQGIPSPTISTSPSTPTHTHLACPRQGLRPIW